MLERRICKFNWVILWIGCGIYVFMTKKRWIIMEYKNKPIIIFGASSGARKVAQIFDNIGVEFEFFVDNDISKWGKEFEGKQIVSPERLREREYAIVIASGYQPEIEEQLLEMGLLNNLVLKEQFIMEYIKMHKDEFNSLSYIRINGNNKTIVIDLVEGIGLGGIETWSIMIADELIKKGKNVLIYSKKTEDKLPKKFEDIVQEFDLDYHRYFQSIKDLVYEIVNKLPCTIISNWQSQVLIAGAIVKTYFPDKIRIVSVLHNDKIDIFRRQQFLDCYTDDIISVSKKIEKQMIDKFGIKKGKMNYKESPIEYEEDYKKLYTMEKDKPIKIGFAARIDKFQKRADLLIELIKELEKEQVFYEMNIAGKGNYFDKLKLFVDENNLHNKVILHGLIARPFMVDFWKKNDIFLSVSDFEGASISMLEAMSYGVVPIVTDVSGVNEFVENRANGIVCSVGDMKEIIEGIKTLEKNRDLLKQYGVICRNITKVKCDKKEYIDYISVLAGKKATC